MRATHRRSGTRLTAQQFKDICRQLDIGAQYQLKLSQALGFKNPALARTLHGEVTALHKAALKSAAHLALAKADLKPDAHAAMLNLVDDQPTPRLDGAALQAYTLSVMNIALVGIVLFIAAPSPRVIAYVAEDPEHPLKEYPSPQAFMQELTRQLRDKARRIQPELRVARKLGDDVVVVGVKPLRHFAGESTAGGSASSAAAIGF